MMNFKVNFGGLTAQHDDKNFINDEFQSEPWVSWPLNMTLRTSSMTDFKLNLGKLTAQHDAKNVFNDEFQTELV